MRIDSYFMLYAKYRGDNNLLKIEHARLLYTTTATCSLKYLLAECQKNIWCHTLFMMVFVVFVVARVCGKIFNKAQINLIFTRMYKNNNYMRIYIR